jgi:lipoyl(octanoyl) transferase
MSELWVCELGVVPYLEALRLQEALRSARQAGEVPDTLLLLEHPPVFTRGRRSAPEELPLVERRIRGVGIEIVDVDRGGRVTYHGPGQLVGYPIMRIGDVIGHLRMLEGAIVAALRSEGVACRGGGDRPTGVWTQNRKIASLGIHVSRRVTTHGFAVNVDNDLEPFGWIVPCGMPDVEMTSVARETGRAGSLERLRRTVAAEVARASGRRAFAVVPDQLAAPVG